MINKYQYAVFRRYIDSDRPEERLTFPSDNLEYIEQMAKEYAEMYGEENVTVKRRLVMAWEPLSKWEDEA